jgi:hypothetical protein
MTSNAKTSDTQPATRGLGFRKSTAVDKIEIRCTPEIRRKFKKIAADFDSYDHVVMWLAEHYEYFKSVRPPTTVPSRKIMLKHGVL